MSWIGIKTLYKIDYSLDDIKNLTFNMEQYEKPTLRKKVDILVIDDQPLSPETYLRNNGFVITHKEDIDSIKDVEPYSVILCDIQGVGKKLGSNKGGAYIIKETKMNYPNKQIIAYTGESFNIAYTNYLKLADSVLEKDTELDTWVDILDNQIKQATEPDCQWKRVRSYLFDRGVSTIRVAELETAFVKSVKNRNFDTFERLANKADDQVKKVLLSLLNSVCVELIKGMVMK